MTGIAPSQTLVRGLDVLEHVASGPRALGAIAQSLGLSRSTVHRLASTLTERRYLNLVPRLGYSLGPKLLELGSRAGEQIQLVRLARPFLNALAERTGDMAFLAARDGAAAIILDRAQGSRRLTPRLRAGDRFDLNDSALARVLLGHEDAARDEGARDTDIVMLISAIRDASGAVRAALGLAGAAAYLQGSAVETARTELVRTASMISAELGGHGVQVGSGPNGVAGPYPFPGDEGSEVGQRMKGGEA